MALGVSSSGIRPQKKSENITKKNTQTYSDVKIHFPGKFLLMIREKSKCVPFFVVQFLLPPVMGTKGVGLVGYISVLKSCHVSILFH